jgi:hypothetical protein
MFFSRALTIRSMGEERDKLIRLLGGIPVSDENLSNAELMARRMESYSRAGRVPPEVEALRSSSILLVGYGTLMNTASMGVTVGPSAEGKPLTPVIVPDYMRLFNLRPDQYQPSHRLVEGPMEAAAANVRPSAGHSFNGLAFPVLEGELSRLDDRERFYERVRVRILSFPEGKPLGFAFVYSAADASPWVPGKESGLLPRWRDIELAREGAYSVNSAFGRMYDQTTYLADGRTLVVSRYHDLLPDRTGR